METLKRDLHRSFSQFEKSVERKELDISNINHDSLYWAHESMDTQNVPVFKDLPEDIKFPIIERNPPRRSLFLELKPRQLQRSRTPETTAVGSTPFSSSLADVAIPYIDPSSLPSLEEKPEVKKPLFNWTEVPNVKHEWIEPLTYQRDKYAHFLLEDCEPTNAIKMLLVATECLGLQNA